MNVNKACYTAIFSNYEDLKDPVQGSYFIRDGDNKKEVPFHEGFDFYCFTDQPLVSNVWKIIQITDYNLSPQRMARQVKLLPHKFLPEYEFTFWLDASFQINIDLNVFWDRHFKSPFTAPDHPLRNCVYREVQSCIVNKRGDHEQIRQQGELYRKLNVPSFNGIITSGVLMRQKTIGCMNMCDEWWEELCKHSARDQIAFANISRGWRYYTFKWDYSSSKELIYRKHYHKRH